ncbi:U32 family peptidase, partial [bacterium]|nr:U32 family peptidase [bacterium]
MTIELITFASTQGQIDSVIKAGATHIILDDPLISIRSWEQPRSFDAFKSLKALIQYINKNYPDSLISIQCDFIYHHHHDEIVGHLIKLLRTCPVNFVRVQDVGLCKQLSAYVSCVLDAQIGHTSWASVQALKQWATRQCLSMEVPASDINVIHEKAQTRLELVVHGQVCIQYSQRRYLLGHLNPGENNESLTQIHRLAEDEDYPGRRFTFLDNPHGHFMFAYFDRSLLADIALLKQCKLQGWV